MRGTLYQSSSSPASAALSLLIDQQASIRKGRKNGTRPIRVWCFKRKWAAAQATAHSIVREQGRPLEHLAAPMFALLLMNGVVHREVLICRRGTLSVELSLESVTADGKARN